jgi:hypothetical protein
MVWFTLLIHDVPMLLSESPDRNNTGAVEKIEALVLNGQEQGKVIQ